jgi:amino acid adenylation domain-containing protein/non-ribosomal peptide synthase protein (TIGR01720 family)
VPIGRPIANTRLHVVDEHLNPTPFGAHGELLIGGAGVSRGYWSRPDLTAERFIPDPFGSEPGARLYRTGDLVRHRADGHLEYLGRIDQQVKVRGFRIEPGEIESVLGQHPGVKDAVVIARDDSSREKRLVAFVVPRTAVKPSSEDLRELLKRALPDYMVPSAFVFLEALPLTPNGKLDRGALPEPGAEARDGRHRVLRTPVEEALAGIWERVLGVSGIGAEENFFELGGHSLLATRVVSQVRKTFAVEVPLRVLFEAPTVRGLAQRIETARGVGRALPPPIERVARGAGLPLSFAQQRLWFLDQFGEGSAYHMPVALRLRGDLDEGALVGSLEELLKRHEALRTRFESVGGREVQVIEPTVSLALERLDVCGLPEGEREAEAKRLVEDEVGRPFDLGQAPLMRTKLLRLGESDHVLVVTLHHIVSDGWSGGVLTRELGELYRGYRSGNGSSLPEPGIQYADYAIWQRGWLSGEVLEEQLAYWRGHLSGVSVLQLPTDRPRPVEQRLEGSSELVVWPAEVLKGLKDLSQREGATLFMVLLAAFQVLLRRWTGQDDVAVGTPIANRTRTEVEGVVGFFVNSLVLRTDLSGDPTFRELLARVKEVALGAYDHQELPFEKLVEALEPERDLSRNPLFQVMFALQNASLDELQLPGLSVTPVDLPVRTTHFDLELHAAEVGGSLVAAVNYRTDLFGAETMRRILGHYGRLLQEVAADASRRVSQLPLLTSAERDLTLVEWNATAQEYPRESSISELFAAQALRAPDALAVVSGAARISYGELHRRSNQLARHLRGLGVGPEVRVGICVERSVEMVVGLLGILKAGGAYVPLDPSYPKERLGFMLEDSGVPVLLAQERLLDVFPEHGARVVCLDRDRAAIAAESVEDLASGARGENVAYAIYTSGSTGRPKGVLLAHDGLVNLALWHSRVYDVVPGDRGTQVASPGFDASVWEVWPYLVSGASLHIPDDETRSNPSRLVSWLTEQGITHSFLPTPLAEAVLKESGVERLGLRYLLTGGDKLHRVDTARLPFRLVNHYGPTESTVVATCVAVGPGGETDPPIGRPIWNTRAYVLDEGMGPVPIGVAGELFIGGGGLARGYLNRPELTAEKFVPDPFSPSGGQRLYRTGDLVRWLGDGTIEFLGRTDHQVKVRGFRIELGEVESVLAKHPGVKDVVVVVREEQPGDKRLVAYLVPESADASPVADLRQYAKSKLPGHMVPSAFVLLAALPLSPNGKLDRRALPAPEGPGAIEGSDEAPRSEVEKRIAAVWQEVLGVERVGVRDNFFDLGGHSLLLLQVHRKLRAELPGRDLSVMDLFRYSTVQSLAEHLSGGQAISGARMLERARRRRDGRSADIAVVAMAGRFPGASGVEEFWKNLRGGVESISFFSDEELRAAGVPGALLRDERYVKARAVLDGVDLFDAGFFGYSPREAEVIDPQQRLFLETAWEALERGGYSAEAYEGLIGVYAGVGINHYWHNLSSNPEVLAAAGGFTTLIGSDKDFLPTRVSYKLNLQGPSVTVQTACSTSLVAVHMACQSLLSHECDMALAGGVSIGLPQKAGYRYQEEGIASPDGHCRAFDAKARGTVSGSGVGIVLLKRLEDALREGDIIEAVIKGSAINNDGSNKVGYTAPGVAGQAAAIAVAQMVGQVEPDTIGYIEAHGTGTTLGDPIEIEALRQAFGPQTRKGFCAIGSLKTNIGHLDAAAGVAGLIKTVLSLKHGELPPSLHYEEPNPKIDFKSSPFFVNDRLRPWPRQGGPRRAGVSSFGIGGTNAHVVLEEAPAVEPSDRSRPWQLLVVSAKSEAAVKVAAAQLGEHLQEHPEQELADVAYTLRTGRRAFIHRRAVVCLDAEDARAALGGGDPRRVLEGVVEESGGHGVAFLFPGQGSQHVGMCAGIYGREAAFREEVDRCAEHLRGELGFDLREVLYPGEAGEQEAARRLGETNVTQPALFVVEWSLAKLWMAWGVKPEAMLGHSIGEYVAACLAGVFSLEDALSLVALRGRLMQGMPKGSMSAVGLPEQEVIALLDGSLGLAAINGPSQCVVSGPEEAVKSLETRLHARGVEYRRLRTSHAFHSPMMEPVLSAFRERVAAVERQAPKIPFVSNLSGTWITENEAMDPGYWARHLREPVRFGAGLSEILKGRPRVLLEVGPGQALRGLARQHPECGPEQVVVASARHSRESRPDEQVLLEALGRLWLAGMDVDWTALQGDQRRLRIPLPTYPFERKRYWVEASNAAAVPGRGVDKKPDIADWFYVPTWSRSMAPRVSGVATPKPASWLVFADHCGLASGMARRLEETGHRVFSVEAGESYVRGSEHSYQIDPRRREDYDALLGDLRARGEQPERIVHLWGLTRDEAGRSETREIEEAQDLGFTSLLLLAQALGTGGAGSPVKLAVFTNGVQDVTGADTLRPEKATVLGPCLVIPQEYPSVRCRSIDVELPASGSWSESHVDQLVNETLGEGPDVAVAYRHKKRWVQGFKAVRVEGPEGVPARLREGGVYLITGGLGGVGLELAEYLARTVKAKLVLVGRSAFPEASEWSRRLEAGEEHDLEVQRIRKLQGMIEGGAEVLVLQGDLGDEAQMRAVLARTLERFGALHGVIHAAGGDKRGRPVVEVDRVHCEEQFRPRVRGMLVLEKVLRGLPLDFCILHSSLASVLGAVGNVAYTAAHVFMDRFAARQTRAEGVPWIAVNWDNWQTWNVEGTAVPAGTANVMTGPEGVEVFHRLLGLDDVPGMVVSTGDLQSRIDRWVGLSFLKDLEETTTVAVSRHPRPALQNAYVAPRNEVEKTLAGIWEGLLGIDQVGVNDNFFELGGDSVVSIQVLARSNAAGLRLTAQQIFERPTIAELAPVAGTVRVEVAEEPAVSGSVPLTPIQHWFFEQPFVDAHHFNQSVLLELRRPVDPSVLERGLEELVRHHDVLRFRYRRRDDGEVEGLAGEPGPVPFSQVDLSEYPEGEQAQALEAAASTLQASLDLSDGPLMRAACFNRGDQRSARLLLVIHHLVVDVISWRVLIEDLETACRQVVSGQPIRLPRKTTSFARWAGELGRYARSETVAKEAGYWLSLPWERVSPLPADLGGENAMESVKVVSTALDVDDTRVLLQDLPDRFKTQVNEVLLTALAGAVQGWTGASTLLVDVEGHGRESVIEGVDLSRSVGWFTSLFPVLLEVGFESGLLAALKSVKEQYRAIPGKGLGYGLLRYLHGDEAVSRRLGELPKAGLSFLYLGRMDQTASEGLFGATTEPVGPSQGPREKGWHLLEVVASVTGGRLRVNWVYSENLYQRSTVEMIAESFLDSLRAIVRLPAEAEAHTASDFPGARLGQRELEEFLSTVRRPEGARSR